MFVIDIVLTLHQLLVMGPGVKPGSVCQDVVSNVDFAPTWLEFAGLRIPNYMQGDSFLRSLKGESYQSEDAVAYHRYFMHRDVIHNAFVSLFLPTA